MSVTIYLPVIVKLAYFTLLLLELSVEFLLKLKLDLIVVLKVFRERRKKPMQTLFGTDIDVAFVCQKKHTDNQNHVCS